MNAPRAEDLIQRARRGDDVALGSLLEWTRPRLAALLRKTMGARVREAIEVDDVLQEVFAAAVQSIRNCRAETADALMRWLAAIAQNVIRKSARRRTCDPVIYIDRESAASGISPSRAMRRDERFRCLQRALLDLTPEQREAIRLVRLEGLKIHEAAHRMGKTPGAIKQLILRALRSLRSRLNETESLNLPALSLSRELMSDDRRRQSRGSAARG